MCRTGVTGLGEQGGMVVWEKEGMKREEVKKEEMKKEEMKKEGMDCRAEEVREWIGNLMFQRL